MAECGMCNSEMNEATGCIVHKVLLTNGEVIESPRHNITGSLDTSIGRCHDCGAKKGGIHHPRCDWARAEGRKQLLSNAVAYWNPEGDSDPRDKESDFIFIVMHRGNESNTTQIFSSLSVANETADSWKDENSSNGVTIHPMTAHDKISPTLKQLMGVSEISDIKPPEIEASHDIYIVDDTETEREPLGAYRSASEATKAAAIWSTLDHYEAVTVSGHPLFHHSPKLEGSEQPKPLEQIEDNSKMLARLEDGQ